MNKFAALRSKRQLTQPEAAKLLGIAKHSVYLYEAGRSKPSYPVLLKYCKVFNVPLDHLMDYVPVATTPRPKTTRGQR